MLAPKTLMLLLVAAVATSDASVHERQEEEIASLSASTLTSTVSSTHANEPGTTVVTSKLTAKRIVQTVVAQDPFIVEQTQDVVWTITTTLAPETTTDVATSAVGTHISE
ncbi:hypothetical protein HDZ31DRAFT_65681 [Schizophyllum fasciatum]